MVVYSPKLGSESQTLKYVQGVGTLAEKSSTQEVFMYPTFKTQGTSMPTFTVGFANNSGEAVNFSPDNIKAFFRGTPIPIYTYVERTSEIQSAKRSEQIALAIVGGLAAGAAAYSASHRTYQSSYSGFAGNRYGSTTFAGTNTVKVYDPLSGIVAGAAIGGATALSIQQVEFNAQNQELAANAILQMNTVDPLQMVTGDLVLKNCCDPHPTSEDVIRFEVTAGGKTSTFQFDRKKVSQ
ncbi:hypothetical protein [Variovorax sp. GT1P44]|uniref:hypothetical protein n=1 Tax=Variovorax sp. GT1P44 TaxID=3443742 RepID=UPI003F4470E4